MPLPNLMKEVKFHTVTLTNKKKFKVRGWKVKEKKEVLLKLEGSQNELEELEAVKAMVTDCMDKPEGVDELSMIELRELICELRKISEGNTIEFSYKCPFCEKYFESQILDLTKDMEKKAFDTSPIEVKEEELRIHLKDLPASQFKILSDKYKDNVDDFNFNYVANCVDVVEHKGKTYSTFSPKEVGEWLGELDVPVLKEILKQIDERLGTFRIYKKIECEECKKEVVMLFGEPANFFVR